MTTPAAVDVRTPASGAMQLIRGGHPTRNEHASPTMDRNTPAPISGRLLLTLHQLAQSLASRRRKFVETSCECNQSRVSEAIDHLSRLRPTRQV